MASLGCDTGSGAWTSVVAARGSAVAAFWAVEPQAHGCSSWA